MTLARRIVSSFLAPAPVVGAATFLLGGPEQVLNRALRSPMYALLIIPVYGGLWLCFWLGWKSWKKIEPALSESFHLRLMQLLSLYRRSYLEHVRYEQRHFNFDGLGGSPHALHITDMFVELHLRPREAPANSRHITAEPVLEGSRTIWDFLRTQETTRAQALVIIGSPGSGKTTLLKSVVMTFARNEHRRHGLRGALPVILAIREHAATISRETAPRLDALVEEHFKDKRTYPSPPPGWFERKFRRGRVVVMLDGLDEVADTEQRLLVSKWVDQQIIAFPTTQFIITSRPDGYDEAPLSHADKLDVQTFTPEQVSQFIHKWYLANEIAAAMGKIDKGVQLRAEERAGDLLSRIRRSRDLSQLTRNPLLVTMLAVVHHYQAETMPEGRAALYGKLCEVLLEKFRAAKGVRPKRPASQSLVVLQRLAAHMMESRRQPLSVAEISKAIALPLAQIGIPDGSAEAFLSEIQESSGLLLDVGNGDWSFAHKTFQEYLTAVDWTENGPPHDWRPYIGDAWWDETLRLYAALGDASRLIRACLDVGTVSAMALAAECVEGSRLIKDLPVRELVEVRVQAAAESTNVTLREFAAKVRITRRLRGLASLDGSAQIDRRFVTCAEYQLFLDSRSNSGRWLQPDHWPDRRFPPGHADAPILGVRPTDAAEFCSWLTEHFGEEGLIRLPTVAEAREVPPTQGDDLATWCQGVDGAPALVGVNPRLVDKLSAQLTALDSLAQPIEMLDILAFPPASSIRMAKILNVVSPEDLQLGLAADRDLSVSSGQLLSRSLLLLCGLAKRWVPDGVQRETLQNVRQLVDQFLFCADASEELALVAAELVARELPLTPPNVSPEKGKHFFTAFLPAFRVSAVQEALRRPNIEEAFTTLERALAHLSVHIQRASGGLKVGAQRAKLQELKTMVDLVSKRVSGMLSRLSGLRRAGPAECRLFVSDSRAPRKMLEEALESSLRELVALVVCALLEAPRMSSVKIHVAACIHTKTPAKHRAALRDYAEALAHQAWIPLHMQGSSDSAGERTSQNAAGAERDETKEQVKRLSAWCKVLRAREAKRLPAWEGIRLVCEKASERTT